MILVDTSAWVEWLIASPTGDKLADHLPEQADWLVPTMVQLELANAVDQAIPHLADNGLINVFAGIPAGETAEMGVRTDQPPAPHVTQRTRATRRMIQNAHRDPFGQVDGRRALHGARNRPDRQENQQGGKKAAHRRGVRGRPAKREAPRDRRNPREAERQPTAMFRLCSKRIGQNPFHRPTAQEGKRRNKGAR